MEQNKITIAHVCGEGNKISDDMLNTLAKSFEMNVNKFELTSIESTWQDIPELHIVIFDNIDYKLIDHNMINNMKLKFKHIHIVNITKREGQSKLIGVYSKKIDHVWESTYNEEYFLTVFRLLLTRATKKLTMARDITFQDLVINRAYRDVRIGDYIIDLTQKEYRVLHKLVEVKGEYINKVDLFKHVWGYDDDTTRLLEQYVHRVKKKIKPYGLSVKIDKKNGVAICSI